MRYSTYRLGVTAPTAGQATAEHDEDDESSARSGRHQLTLINELPASGLDLADTLDRIERRYLELALQRAGGVQTRAAELLGMSFRQFRYKLQKHRGEPCSKRHASALNKLSAASSDGSPAGLARIRPPLPDPAA